MSAAGLGNDRLAQQVADLGHAFLRMDLGQTAECAPLEELWAAAAAGAARSNSSEHVRHCPRCSGIVTAFRSLNCVRNKPSSWHVHLAGIRLPGTSDWPYEVLGRISLSNDTFAVCADESEWTPHALAVRVNLILDTGSGLFTATLLEVPSEVQGVSLLLDEREYILEGQAFEGTYELVLELGDFEDPHLMQSFESIVDALESGRTQLLFKKLIARNVARSQEPAAGSLLEQEQVIERKADYILPCGKHTDTFINMARLCHSEGSLLRVASELRELFRDASFDTIVTNGWAMAMLARRVASSCQRPGGRRVREIMCEGYDPPIPTEDIPSGSRVLVLADVVVTGGLITRLQQTVREAGATVAAVGSVAMASTASADRGGLFRSLCVVPMRLDEPGECPRCDKLERLEFNPYANCMTAKTANARSPSQFIAYNEEAHDFWEIVDRAGAYESHRVVGNCHYTAFVDTARLLRHHDLGPSLIERLREKIVEADAVPTLLLAPRRQRAQLLVSQLSQALELATPRGRLPAVQVTRRNEAWHLTEAGRRRLQGQRVLIIDSAAGYGRTIDSLASAALRAGAKTVGSVVVLSRLTEACETAFARRLSGGFFRLFHLPVHPVVIRGSNPSLCPVCRRKQAVRDAAKESGMEAIQWWADRLSNAGHFGRSTDPGKAKAPKPEEPWLFPLPEPSFLERCSGSVAGGVTLHSLHAAMRNGMAPLTLPEIRDETIPSRNRTAMVESLPVGVVEWSRGYLEKDLLHFLAAGNTASLWRASAEVLARETGAGWISHLGDILRHANSLRHRAMPMFWSSIACDVYLVGHRNPDARQFVRNCLESLIKEYEKTAAGDGLRQVLSASNV